MWYSYGINASKSQRSNGGDGRDERFRQRSRVAPKALGVGVDLLIGVDAGTSVIKAVAFDLAGRQVGSASVPNRYASGPDGSATQSLTQTWEDCAAALRG